MFEAIIPGVLTWDMRRWPRVKIDILRSVAASDDMIGALAEKVEALIRGCHARDMQFELVVTFHESVAETFLESAPFAVQFALMLAKPDLLEMSKTCLAKTTLRFAREDAELVEVAEELLRHIPKGAPLLFTVRD